MSSIYLFIYLFMPPRSEPYLQFRPLKLHYKAFNHSGCFDHKISFFLSFLPVVHFGRSCRYFRGCRCCRSCRYVGVVCKFFISDYIAFGLAYVLSEQDKRKGSERNIDVPFEKDIVNGPIEYTGACAIGSAGVCH